MQVTTKAIVFSAIKYGDSSLIVRCYTELSGLKTYMLRGVLKSKKAKIKPAYFQPLSQLELTASHNNKGNLNSVKDARIVYAYESIYTDFVKQSLVFFLSEILSNTVREEEGSAELFSFLSTSFKWLDLHDKIANFHICFLLNLSKYLGFYPDVSNKNLSYFDLKEGAYSDTIPFGEFLSGMDLRLFNSVLGINFDKIINVSFNVKERQRLLEIIIKYYELHLVGLKRLKSIDILKELFS